MRIAINLAPSFSLSRFHTLRPRYFCIKSCYFHSFDHNFMKFCKLCQQGPILVSKNLHCSQPKIPSWFTPSISGPRTPWRATTGSWTKSLSNTPKLGKSLEIDPKFIIRGKFELIDTVYPTIQAYFKTGHSGDLYLERLEALKLALLACHKSF